MKYLKIISKYIQNLNFEKLTHLCRNQSCQIVFQTFRPMINKCKNETKFNEFSIKVKKKIADDWRHMWNGESTKHNFSKYLKIMNLLTPDTHKKSSDNLNPKKFIRIPLKRLYKGNIHYMK